MAKQPVAKEGEVIPPPVAVKSWLKHNHAGHFLVDQDKAYAAVLSAMRSYMNEDGTVVAGNIESPALTKAELETAFQIIKMKTQAIAENIEKPPGATLIFLDGDPNKKSQWRQEGKSAGTPLTSGQLRDLYQKVSGALNN